MELMALTGLITIFGLFAAWATRPSNLVRDVVMRDRQGLREHTAGRADPRA
jgi:hypothetical protein